MTERTFYWRFKTAPTRAQVERFIERQISLFARYTNYLTGADGKPIVDTFIVTHNDGSQNLEFQLNGTPGNMGEIFAFPGYFPGDTDDAGKPLYNQCATGKHFYGKIVGMLLERASKEFDMEYTTSAEKAKQYQTA